MTAAEGGTYLPEPGGGGIINSYSHHSFGMEPMSAPWLLSWQVVTGWIQYKRNTANERTTLLLKDLLSVILLIFAVIKFSRFIKEPTGFYWLGLFTWVLLKATRAKTAWEMPARFSSSRTHW